MNKLQLFLPNEVFPSSQVQILTHYLSQVLTQSNKHQYLLVVSVCLFFGFTWDCLIEFCQPYYNIIMCINCFENVCNLAKCTLEKNTKSKQKTSLHSWHHENQTAKKGRH